MQSTLLQLQQLYNIYVQLNTTLNVQLQHLKLLIHIVEQEKASSQNENETNGADMSNEFVQNSINSFVESLQAIGMAINQLKLSNVGFNIALNQTNQSNAVILDGLVKANASNAIDITQTKQLNASNVEQDNGLNQTLQSNVIVGLPSNQITNANIDLVFDASKINVNKLKTRIKDIIIKCSRKTAFVAAQILIEVYSNPKQSYNELIKLTDMSIGGLSKHLAMLKKRGFIEKVSFQQFKPTSLSLKIMSESCV